MIRRISLAVCTLLLLTLSAATATAAPIPKLIAHRGIGDSTTIGENTIPAMQYAIGHHADMLEFDVAITSDAKMVIMHDATLDRTTDCTGQVASKTLAEVKACTTDIGNSHPPSLRQLLLAVKGSGLPLHIGMKRDWTRAQAGRLADELRRQGMATRSVVTSYDKSNLKDLKAEDPGIRRGLRWLGAPPSISYVKSYGTQLDMDLSDATSAFVQACKDHGVTLYLWTADSSHEYLQMAHLKAPNWGVQDTGAAHEWMES